MEGQLIISVEYDEQDGYAVALNGQTILECLSEDEVGSLTIAEMQELLLRYF